ncbi:MAG TPA: glycosyltransferase family 1 protein [Candidatus Dormibacteraeota bacterium]|nr:glycosyltransferase family 1 protein [Candidatus Dormibacteraeota bacterium]
MSPIAVALDMTFPNRNRGGTGVYARSLLEALRNRDDVSAKEIAGPLRSNVAGTLAWLVSGAARDVRALGSQVLHCPSFVIPWGVRAPVVVTVHDAAARQVPGGHPLEWRLYDRVILPRRLQAAACVITDSKTARDDIVREYGIAAARVTVIPLGVDARFFAADGGNPYRPGDHNLLFPGAPIPRKNIDAVLEAMVAGSAGSAISAAHLDISGATALDFPDVAWKIDHLGLRDRVRWLGHVPDSEMPAVVARASAVLYPSLAEGFGLPVLEAFAAGVAVVSSNRGPIPELSGDAAMLVDPTDVKALRDAIEAVLTNAELRAALQSRGASRAKHYTWEKCAEMTCDVYRSVITEGRVRS